MMKGVLLQEEKCTAWLQDSSESRGEQETLPENALHLAA